MIPEARIKYNASFTEEKYRQYIRSLENLFPGQLEFRVAETPIFIPRNFTQKMLEVCESIIDVVLSGSYMNASQASIPPAYHVPGENRYPHFIAFDFGICEGPGGEPEPQLIELQGFPSLFCWQALLPGVNRQYFDWDEQFSPYPGMLDEKAYLDLLKKIIIGNEDPNAVVLLEILPQDQKTRVDFYASEQLLGIKTVCITEVLNEGKQLYYLKDGKKQVIRRIYNRVIFDELAGQPESVKDKAEFFFRETDVEWIPHPNWFFRVSKYTLPFIEHPNVPSTRFLSQAASLPADLENYVVKPLFSFAGQGVIIDVTAEKLAGISNKENWILQKKVNYTAAIKTPGENAKGEIRLFYFWEPGKPRPVPAGNLGRLSKGKMVGVRYNKNKDWVGGTFCLFEK